MIVNPHKFQSVITNRLGKLNNSYDLLIDNHKVDSENSVTLLGIEIDNQLENMLQQYVRKLAVSGFQE